MSEYTTARARPVRVTLAQRVLAGTHCDEIVREHSATPVDLPAASEVAGFADALRREMARAPAAQASMVEAVLASVADSPGVAAAVAAIDGRDLQMVEGSATPGAAELLDSFDTTARQLAVDERRVVAAIFSESLEEQDFHVTTEVGVGATRLRGVQANRVVEVETHDFGLVEVDVAGCEGGSCTPVVQAVFEGAEARGLEIAARQSQYHQDPGGGTLVRRRAGASQSASASRSAAQPSRVVQ